MSVTDRDREKAMRIAGWWPLIYESFAGAAAEGNPDDLDALHTVDAIAAALAEEREKARAQVAWDLRDLINDSGGQVWTRALLDFAEGLEAK